MGGIKTEGLTCRNGLFWFQGDLDGALGETGVEASITGEGCGEKYKPVVEAVFAVVFDADGEAGVLLEAGGEQAVQLDVHARFAEGGITVVEQQSAVEGFEAAGELVEQERGSGGGVHGRSVAEQAQKLEADGLAGVFLAGTDIEGGRKRRARNDVGVHGPEGEQVELLGGAVEVLLIEIGDLIDQVVGVGIGGFGIHSF